MYVHRLYTHNKIVAFKKRSQGAPVMIIGESPEENPVDVRVSEVESRNVIITVCSQIDILQFDVQLSDP